MSDHDQFNDPQVFQLRYGTHSGRFLRAQHNPLTGMYRTGTPPAVLVASSPEQLAYLGVKTYSRARDARRVNTSHRPQGSRRSHQAAGQAAV